MDRQKQLAYLQKIDEVIAHGIYKDNWESLSAYPVPQWYRDNQFNLNVIDCKFNDIVRTIKNERNGNGRNNGLGDDYKRELLASLQATR